MAEINLIPDYMKIYKNQRNKSKIGVLLFVFFTAVIFLSFFMPVYIANQIEGKINHLKLQSESEIEYDNSVINNNDITKIKNYIKYEDEIRNNRIVLAGIFNDLIEHKPNDIEILEIQFSSKGIVLNCQTINFDSLISFTSLVQNSMGFYSADLENISVNQIEKNYFFTIKIEFNRGK